MAKMQNCILIFAIIFAILPANVSSARKEKELPNILERPRTILQQQNFHEPNRWKPPVRLIPFNMNRLRVFRPDEEDDSESGSGSGMDTAPACDDEDGDCSDKADEIEIVSGAQTESPAKTFTVPDPDGSSKTSLQTTSPTQDTVNLSLNTRLNAVKSGGNGMQTTRMPVSPNVTTSSNNIPNAEAKYWTKKDVRPTSWHLFTALQSKNNVNKDKMVTSMYHITKVNTKEVTINSNCGGANCKNSTEPGRIDKTTTNRNNENSVLFTTKLVQYKQNFTNENRRSTTPKKQLTTKPTFGALTTYRNEIRPQPSRQKAMVSDADFSKIKPTQSANILIKVANFTSRQNTNPSSPWPTILNRRMLRQNVTTTNADGVISSKTRATIASLTAGRKEIYENFVEKYSLNVCNVLLCGNGLCIEEGRNRGKCLCPIGKGGKHCQKEANFTHPSFSGNSYLLFNQTKEFPKDFSFIVEFRADDANGLLLFGAGTEQPTDKFFALILVDGFLQFRLKCGPGFITISTSRRIKLGDWNRAIIRKRKSQVTIQTNGASVKSWMGDCMKDQIETGMFYLGGLPHNAPHRRNIGLVEGFIGCIREFVVNRENFDLNLKKTMAVEGLDIGDCSVGSCARSDCNKYARCIPERMNTSRCLCPVGRAGSTCSKAEPVSIPKFSGSGFLEFEGLYSAAWSKIEIEIVLKPESETGLILFNGDRTDGQGDFIALTLKHGFVEFSYDCGTGAAVIRSKSRLSMNQWHVIRASRKGKFGWLHVNSDKVVNGTSKGPFQMLKLRKPLYIGGIRFFTDVPVVSEVHTHFRGCIEKVLINQKKLNWTNSISGQDVTNCHSHECLKDRCSNHGRCESHKGESWCHCRLGYSGDRCEKEIDIGIPMFDGHSYLKFDDRRLFKHLANPTSVLSFEFKTKASNGLLLWNGQRNYDIQPAGDFLSIALVNGYVICRYDLGDGQQVLNSTKQLNDGNWHEVKLVRMNGKGEMNVDKTNIIKTSSAGNYTMLNTDGELFIGGADDIPRRTRSIYVEGFIGCMKNLKIGIREIDLIKDAESGHHITNCNVTPSS